MLQSSDIPVMLMDTPAALGGLIETLRSTTAFAYDYEAVPLEWWHKDYRAHTIAFAGRDPDGTLGAVVVPLWHPDHVWDPNVIKGFLHQLAPILADNRKAISVHNFQYEGPVTYRLTGIFPWCSCDTMVAANILDENRLVGLKSLGQSVLGWPDWDIDAKVDHPLNELAQYNGLDAAATFLLREEFVSQLSQQERLLRYFQAVEMPKVRSIANVTVNGFYPDGPTLKQRWLVAQNRKAEAQKQIPVKNPGSSQQLAKWLYEDLKLPILALTPKGKPSTDESTLNQLVPNSPEVRQIFEYRRPGKQINTYFKSWAEMRLTSYTNLAYANYRTTSAETGRLASGYHTTPRDPFVRSVITAPEGWTFVQCDYSQVEARLAAWTAAGKPQDDKGTSRGEMLQAFLAGRDIYREAAAEFFRTTPDQVTKQQRQDFGKVPTLASLYRISARGLQEYAWRQAEIVLTLAQAERAWAAFHMLWPEFKLWHEREELVLTRRGYAQSELGRMRRLPDAMLEPWGKNGRLIHMAVNSGINMPIQSLASDILQTAMALVLAAFPREHVRIVGNVHDAGHFWVRTSRLEYYLPQIVWCMLHAPDYLRELGLRLPAGLIQCETTVGAWGAGVEHDVEPAEPQGVA